MLLPILSFVSPFHHFFTRWIYACCIISFYKYNNQSYTIIYFTINHLLHHHFWKKIPNNENHVLSPHPGKLLLTQRFPQPTFVASLQEIKAFSCSFHSFHAASYSGNSNSSNVSVYIILDFNSSRNIFNAGRLISFSFPAEKTFTPGFRFLISSINWKLSSSSCKKQSYSLSNVI